MNTVADVDAADVEVADVLDASAILPAQDLVPAADLVPGDDVLPDEDVLVGDVVLTGEDVLAGDAALPDEAVGTHGDDDGIPGELDPLPVEDNEGIKIAADGEPPDKDARLTVVTETLAASALVPEVAFVSEPRSAAAVWDAGQAVTEIYRGHYGQLVRLALLLVHDVQTAEEVVQDAFVSMNDAWRRLHDAEKALSYLRQTVVNRSRSVLRHRKVVDMHAPKPAPDEPSAEQAAMAVLESDAVGAALRMLPERQREAIVLRYYLDLSEADIAKTMGISKGAVKSHTARAMAALKSILLQETS